MGETLISLILLGVVMAVAYWILSRAIGYFGAPVFILQAFGAVCVLVLILAFFRAFGVAPYGWHR